MRRQFDAACRQYAVKTAQGDGLAEWADGLKSVLPSVKMLGKTEQAADPTPTAPQEVKGNNAAVRSMGKNLLNEHAAQWQSASGGTGNWVQEGTTITFSGTSYFLYDFINHISTDEPCTLSLDVLECSDSADTELICTLIGRFSDGLYIEKSTKLVANQRVSVSVVPTGKPFTSLEIRPIRKMNKTTTMHASVANLQVEIGSQATSYQPYYDGGEATAPNLMCAVDGSCQSTYDPQTGEFVNWWLDKITLNGSENWRAATAPDEGKCGFTAEGIFPEKLSRNACWSNQTAPQAKRQTHNGTPELWCGMGNGTLLAFNFGFYDETLRDKGASNWKAYLAEHPLEIWAARSKPEITNIGAQPLTCPTGYGQIVQVEGDIPDCPLEVQYLAHGGNVR